MAGKIVYIQGSPAEGQVGLKSSCVRKQETET